MSKQPLEKRQQERAHQRSEMMEFDGRKLHPFSHLRQTLCLVMGIKYWTLTPDDLRTLKNPHKRELADEKLSKKRRKEIESEPDEVQTYDGLPHDAAIVLWACSQDDATCIRARREAGDSVTARDRWEGKIDAFADKAGITLTGRNFQAASLAFMQIVNDVNSTTGEPQLPEGGESDESDDDESGN